MDSALSGICINKESAGSRPRRTPAGTQKIVPSSAVQGASVVQTRCDRVFLQCLCGFCTCLQSLSLVPFCVQWSVARALGETQPTEARHADSKRVWILLAAFLPALSSPVLSLGHVVGGKKK